jgi:CRISPR-associated protein Cmr2
MTTHLHFTFGPVQGFVAQARRTRDLYAGSFLLSHLALTAMKAARDAGGTVLLPDLAAIERLAGTTEHAVAPNRFVARFDDERTAAEAGRKAAIALKDEWQRIANAVRQRFLDAVANQGQGTRDIWQRQIAAFWEIAWAVGKPDATDLLDRRKNWRTPPVTVEPGDHCTLMGQWQELSGFVRSHQRQSQEAFWQAVRQQVLEAKGTRLDLEDDERLCAIAFVKRFFPLVARDAIGRDLGMDNWPSTVSIAAVPWLRKIRSAPAEVLARCRAYAELVHNEPGALVSSAGRIRALQEFPVEAGEFPRLSGNFLNRTALANERGTPLQPTSDRQALLRKLRELEETTGDRAGNFYALLLMDGDSMGQLIRAHGAGKITPALTAFSGQAPDIIAQHDGICIYAGGDDLLAMLPLDRALQAVLAARKAYCEAFSALNVGHPTGTISAGLVFAHYRCAFSRVLAYAHELLDDVAKDGAGRDAIALGVLKPGGVACQWCSKFDSLLANGVPCFAPLIEACRKGQEDRNGTVGSLSSSFLYNLRERFAELFDQTEEDATASVAPPFDRDTLLKLFMAEYLHDKIEKHDPAKAAQQRQQAQVLIGQLLKICEQPGSRFRLDGLRLVKFLALEGKEGAE